MSDMPWDRVELRGWSIVGMNHYYVAMINDGRCIKAEDADDSYVWKLLARQAFNG